MLRTFTTDYVLRVLEQPHQGPAEARNLGVASATSALVLFLDDDVVPWRDLIAIHLATHAAEGPKTVVIGPMMPPHDWARSAWVQWEEEKLQSQYDAMLAGEWTATERQFYTANSSLERALFLVAGGFDARFKRAEDVELGYRLRNLGARFIFTPAADVLHYASRTFSAWRRTPYQYGRYDVIMSREKGHEALGRALHEFRGRHPLNRVMSWAVTGRPRWSTRWWGFSESQCAPDAVGAPAGRAAPSAASSTSSTGRACATSSAAASSSGTPWRRPRSSRRESTRENPGPSRLSKRTLGRRRSRPAGASAPPARPPLDFRVDVAVGV